jgi:hypothetical protein
MSNEPSVCPLCRREGVPIVDTTGYGDLAIGEHRYTLPIFPTGYAGKLHKARCPMSGARLTEVCDGEHASPPCRDPECWTREQCPTGTIGWGRNP